MGIIERKKVESSQIESIGYSPEDEIVEVEFKGKTRHSIYRYYKVDVATAEGFLNAPSKGTFLGQRIKGKFNFEKVDEIIKEPVAPV